MRRFYSVAVLLAFAAAVAVAPGCKKAEETKPEVKMAPKAATKVAPKPAPKTTQPSGSAIEKETLDACVKKNPENTAYCKCYANEVGSRYAEKAKSGNVTPQDRGHIAVQAALVCRRLNRALPKK